MKQKLIVATLALTLLGAPLTANPVSAQSNTSACSSTNNTTAQDLCDRVNTLEGRVSQLESENQKLQSEVNNSHELLNNLEGIPENQRKKVRNSDTVQGKVAKIEAYLGGSSKFDTSNYQEYRDLGAWDSRENRPGMPDSAGPGPAFMKWVNGDNAGLYVFVGAGNGDKGMKNQWKQVLSGDTTLAGNITFTLPYAPEGVNRDQVIRNGLDSSATQEIETLVQQFNQPSTRYQWETWNNDQRNSSEQVQSLGMYGGAGIGLIFLPLLGMFIQYKTRWLNKRAQKRSRQQNAIDVETIHGDKVSIWTRTGRTIAGIPVIGLILKKLWSVGSETKTGVRRGGEK